MGGVLAMAYNFFTFKKRKRDVQKRGKPGKKKSKRERKKDLLSGAA